MKKGIYYVVVLFFLFFQNIVFSENTMLDVQLSFQNPSYLREKLPKLQTYICDSTQAECRVNYNLEINEWSGYKTIGSKYTCLWDFWMQETTGEEQKCNPNTIIYATGVFQTSLKVSLKTDENIYYSQEFVVQNEQTVEEAQAEDTHEDAQEPEIDEKTQEENIWPENGIETPIEEKILEENSSEEELPSQENTPSIPQDNTNIIDEETEQESQTTWELNAWEEGNDWDQIEAPVESAESNISLSGSWVWEYTSTGDTNKTTTVFSTKFLFQSPTYLLEKEDENIYAFTCDTSQSECRVNFNLNIDEGGGYKTIGTKYICQWNFWMQKATGEEQKCNPNTIIYPVWEFLITYTVQEKWNIASLQTQTLRIKNTGYKEPQTTKTVYISSSNSPNLPTIVISSPEIEVQSWLDKDNICTKETCSINVKYTQKNPSEKCLWNFPWGNYDWNIQEKCNPGNLHYPIWDFKITLKVYDKNYPENYKEAYLDFSHKWKDSVQLWTGKTLLQNTDIKLQEEKIYHEQDISTFTLKITQVLPNPTWADNLEFIEIQNIWEKVIDLEGCYLDDMISSGSKPYKFSESFLLDAKQRSIFYKYDTKININNSWKEEVRLICNDKTIDIMEWEFSSPEWFILKPEQQPLEIIEVKKQKNTMNYEVYYRSWEKQLFSFDEKSTFIENIMMQDISREEKKEKLFQVLETSFTQKISKQKTGIKISWVTLPNSSLLITLEKEDSELSFFPSFFQKAFANLNYETKSDKNGKYELQIIQPDIWAFEVKTSLYLSENNTYEFEKTSHVEIDDDYMNYIAFSSKKEISLEEYNPPKAIISLQWKLTQNKIFSWNKVTCINTDTCSINLDGSMSEGKKLTYFWDFWNGKTSHKKNPESHTFTPGLYFISLQVKDTTHSDATYFMVEVQGKTPKNSSFEKEKENKIEKNNKINIIPTAYADSKKDENIKYHIILSLWVFVLFFIGSLILLRRQKII